MRTVGSALGLMLASVALAACTSGDGAGDASAGRAADVRHIERSMEKHIDQKLGVAGTRVVCPDRVVWQVGDSFRCAVTSPGFPPGYGVVTLEQDDYSWYISNTCEENGPDAPPFPSGCVTPSPADGPVCPWVNGKVDCTSVTEPPSTLQRLP